LMREGYGFKVRVRSAKNVVDEMEHLVKQGATIITFDDENFTPSRKHVKAVCEEINRRQINIPWIAHARVDEVDDDLLKLMGSSGCVLIRCGMETGNKRVLKLLKKTRDEDAWFQKSYAAVKSAQSHGIKVACLFMVGTPTETYEEFMESVAFAKRLGPDIIQVSYFTLFPGTALYEDYKDRLKEMKINTYYHYELPQINVSEMTMQQLHQAQSYFYKQFLMRPSFVIKHFCQNFLFYIYNHELFLRLLQVRSLFKEAKKY